MGPQTPPPQKKRKKTKQKFKPSNFWAGKAKKWGLKDLIPMQITKLTNKNPTPETCFKLGIKTKQILQYVVDKIKALLESQPTCFFFLSSSFCLRATYTRTRLENLIK